MCIWKGAMNVHHYLTVYEEDGKRYAESWIQINLFGKCFCLCRRKKEI